jgi:hypothetical protein
MEEAKQALKAKLSKLRMIIYEAELRTEPYPEEEEMGY